MAALRFDGRVALVTGAGRGLGREHALLLAARGCKVVVNDPGSAYDGTGALETRVADAVVAEIRAAGGEAAANYDSVEQGERVVQTALDVYGRLDVVVNNAGILTPEVWSELTLDKWRRVIDVNLTGVFSVMKAAWPVFVRQKYGRCVMTASPAIHGAGVAAYSASKTAVIGLAASLQFEARKLKMDIKVNTVIPQADTRMTRDFAAAVAERKRARGGGAAKPKPAAKPARPASSGAAAEFQKKMMARMAPGYVSPLVAWLCHESCAAEATIHEAGAGYFAQLRWQRSAPLFATDREGVSGPAGPEALRDGAPTLRDFARGDAPPSGDGSMGGSGLERVMRHLSSKARL